MFILIIINISHHLLLVASSFIPQDYGYRVALYVKCDPNDVVMMFIVIIINISHNLLELASCFVLHD